MSTKWNKTSCAVIWLVYRKISWTRFETCLHFKRQSRRSFLNYIYNAETSRALFSPSKDKIPNAFTSTALIKHYSAIADECHRTNNLLQQIERSQSVNIQKMSLWIQLNLFMKTLKFISTTKRISPSTFRFKCEWYLQQSCRNV